MTNGGGIAGVPVRHLGRLFGRRSGHHFEVPALGAFARENGGADRRREHRFAGADPPFSLIEAHGRNSTRMPRVHSQAPWNFSMATKKLIPEPSQRLVIWLVAFATAALCAILVFDYAIGDRRMAWTGHTPTKPVEFKKLG